MREKWERGEEMKNLFGHLFGSDFFRRERERRRYEESEVEADTRGGTSFWFGLFLEGGREKRRWRIWSRGRYEGREREKRRWRIFLVRTFFRSGLFKRGEYVGHFLELDDARKKKGLIKWFFLEYRLRVWCCANWTTQVLYAMETMAFASHTKRRCDCGAYIRVVDSLARNCGLKKKTLIEYADKWCSVKRVSFLAFVFTFFGVFGITTHTYRCTSDGTDGTGKRGVVY